MLIIESIFAGLLYVEVLKAEQSAARQYDILRASQALSELSDLLLRHRRVVDAGRHTPQNEASINAERESASRVRSKLRVYVARVKKAGLNDDGTKRIEQCITDVTSRSDRVFRVGITNSASQKAYDEFIEKSTAMYGLAMNGNQSTRQLLSARLARDGSSNLSNESFGEPAANDFAAPATNGSTQPVTKGPSELTADSSNEAAISIFLPEQLMLVGMVTNLLLALAIAILIWRGITQPISTLAKNCDRLMLGKTIPAPKIQRNEISELEMTFCKMSMLIAINEDARKSFLQHLKLVQGAKLTSIRERIDKLSGGTALKPKARNQFDNMKTAIDAMLHLLQQMTDELSFNASAITVPNQTKTSTTEIYDTSISNLNWLAHRRQIELVVEDPHCELFIDKDLLVRVLNNLLSNAIKFSSGSSTVKLIGIETENEVRTEVHDSGPGISDKDRTSLFQKFKQLAPEDGQHRKGTGLGLMIAKNIVEAHGGKIGCDSIVGKGSCFWFTLPRSPQKQNSENQNQKTTENQSAKTQRPRTSISVWFIGLFVVFLCGQVGLALELNNRLDEASSKARQFVLERTNLLDTEGLLYTFLNWRQKAADAIKTSNHQALFDSTSLVSKQISQAGKLEERFKQDARLHEDIVTVKALLEEVDRGFDELMDSFGSAAGNALLQSQVQRADKGTSEIEKRLFEILRLQAGKVDSSYDLAVKLRREINEALALTAIFNLAVIALATAIGFWIVARIRRLNEKAMEFASGGTPRTTISGNDELSHLDFSLCEAVAEIRQAEEQRRNLMAAINHDLRTPLTSIMMGMEMLTEGLFGELQGDDFDALLALQKEIEKLHEQISDLLSIEKAEGGAIECRFESIDVLEFVESIAESMRIRLKGAKVRLDVIADELPKEARVIIDPELAQRALSALIENSIAASKPGSTVEIRLVHTVDGVNVSIEDHGDGLNAQLQEIVFERFRSVDGKALVGLGLPLASVYCGLFGGNLQLVRSDNTGTVMAVFLPSAH